MNIKKLVKGNETDEREIACLYSHRKRLDRQPVDRINEEVLKICPRSALTS
jgi:hypothetical protein